MFPKVGILSPILSNIYLHAFDEFMEEVKAKYNSKWKIITEKNSPNHLYRKAQKSYSYYVNKINKTDADKKIIDEKYELVKKLSKLVTPSRTSQMKIYYVRYADDFIVQE